MGRSCLTDKDLKLEEPRQVHHFSRGFARVPLLLRVYCTLKVSVYLHAKFLIMSTDCRFSRYLRTRENGGTVAVFHELHPEPLYLSTSDWIKFQGNPMASPSVKSALEERGLIIRSDDEDDLVLNKTIAALEHKLSIPTILYLVLSKECNFSCAYCPVPGFDLRGKTVKMPNNTAASALRAWANCICDSHDPTLEYFIILYGGEPTLNRDAIIFVLEEIANLKSAGKIPQNVRVMLSSNGSLFDKELVHILARTSTLVAVGCDGPDEYHNSMRVDNSGATTYDTVRSAIAALVDAGVVTYLSVSVTPRNIQAISSFSTVFKSYGVAGFGFNILRGKLLVSLVGSDQLDKYFDDAVQGIIDNYITHPDDQSFEYQMHRKASAYFQKRFFPTDCNGYGNQLVIRPDGSIGTCPFLEDTLGNVQRLSAEFHEAHARLSRKWRNRLPIFNPECRSCDAKSICGGGCAWNSHELNGDLSAIDKGMCKLNKAAFTHFLWHGNKDGKSNQELRS